ncbi:MAG TPA: hypothetical protein VFX03_06210, partial [Thermomicrobiales bacterium]|nr:hypothetical protein [Thermomicrobiales bacterium]
MNRRKLLRGALVGSALVAGGRMGALAADAPAPRASRRAAYQAGGSISALVPSFGAVGDGFMRDQAKAFETNTGIHVDMQFLPFEKAM